MNNKNKYIIMLLIVLSFFSFKGVVFAKDIITYDLNEGKMYIDFNPKKNITEAVLICNGSTIANFNSVNSTKLDVEVNISGKLTNGNYKCNVNYYIEGSVVAQAALKSDVDVIITTPRGGNIKDNTCVSIMATDKSLEYNCKEAGCKWSGGSCHSYASTVNNVVSGNNSSVNNSEPSGSGNGNGGFSGGGSGRGGSTSTGTDDVTDNVSGDKTPLNSSTFCKDISPGLKIAGYTIVIIKIITPLAIILMGSFDFYKAVSSGKADDLKKQAIMLGNRVLVGVIIFFLPTILKTALNFISGDSEYITCIDCLFDPTKSCK